MKKNRLILGVALFAAAQLMPAQNSHPLVINVEDYGAVPNGSTDNTNAINQAINATHPGYRLYFPCTTGGAYKVTSPINFGSLTDVTIAATNSACSVYYQGPGGAPSAFSMVGAERVTVKDIGFFADPNSAPQTVLMLGRPTANAQSGAFHFENVHVEGYASKAIVYSIASEENTWTQPTIILNGGGAKYAFYTSWQDDLGVDNLPSGSNLSMWMQNFHILDFSPNTDSSHELISDEIYNSSVGDHTYRDGYLATGGTSVGIKNNGAGWWYLATGRLTFDNIRGEGQKTMFLFDSPAGASDVAITIRECRSDTQAQGSTFVSTQQPATFRLYDSVLESNIIADGTPTTYGPIGALYYSSVREGYGPPSYTANVGSVVIDLSRNGAGTVTAPTFVMQGANGSGNNMHVCIGPDNRLFACQ